jgi:hypothetical protein
VTKGDVAVLTDALGFIKEQSPKKTDRKVAAEVMIKLDRIGRDWDAQVVNKQISLKPRELRMIADLRDIYSLDLSPQLKNWHVPR